MNSFTKILVLFCSPFCLCFFPSLSLSSGFHVPNQSSTAIALNGAHIAFTPGADASYFNPANMAWLDDNLRIEGGVTIIVLPSIVYEDSRTPLFNGKSETETIATPQLFMVSEDYENFRFGFSLTCPFGLSKRWQQPFPQASAEEFSLKVIEGNPVVSFKVSDRISIGAGLRLLYAEGEAVSLAANPPLTSIAPLTELGRDLDGNTLEAGYNLALSIRPDKNLHLAATYRSGIDLGLEGDARLSAVVGEVSIASYDGGGAVEVATPAVLSLAAAYTFKKLTAELVWERAYWSCFDQLDFQYDQSFQDSVFDVFDSPISKHWKDTDAFKIGFSYRWNEKFKTYLGMTVDKSPVPEETLGFELPGADSVSYSGGLWYQLADHAQVAISYLYNHTESRSVTNLDATGQTNISGVFSGGGAHLINTAFSYKF